MTNSVSISEIKSRIRAHNSWMRKDADVQIRSGISESSKVIKDGDRRELVVVANTARIDQDDEVVVPEGADIGYFGENRSVFFDHMYDEPNFIGKARTGYPKLSNGLWIVRFGVRRSERGEQLLRDAEDFGVSVSIGYDALDKGPPTDKEIQKYGGGKEFRSIVRKWFWAELSVTWIPSNPEARSPHPEKFSSSPKSAILTPFGVFGMPLISCR